MLGRRDGWRTRLCVGLVGPKQDPGTERAGKKRARISHQSLARALSLHAPSLLGVTGHRLQSRDGHRFTPTLPFDRNRRRPFGRKRWSEMESGRRLTSAKARPPRFQAEKLLPPSPASSRNHRRGPHRDRAKEQQTTHCFGVYGECRRSYRCRGLASEQNWR
jgi:hypothetical protein